MARSDSTTPARDWVTIALPSSVMSRVDDYLEKDRTYRSRGELIKRAVLDLLDARAEA